MINHALRLSEPASVNGHQNKKKIGITVGVTSFGLIIRVFLIIRRKRGNFLTR